MLIDYIFLSTLNHDINLLVFCFAVPGSFAPILEVAMTIVEHSGGQSHVLLIIADGQVFTLILLN